MSQLRVIVAITVTLIWAASWIAAIITHDYQGIGLVTPVMLFVVGYIFAKEAISSLRNGSNETK